MAIHSTPQQFLNDLIIMLSTQFNEMKTTLSHYEESYCWQSTRVVVRVPTSEHVAQIIGKHGSKIKNLRAKTNTFIKTPYRENEPLFIIYGCIHGVLFAKCAIEQASKHFSSLSEARYNLSLPGEITTLVEVPQQYVGAVIGRRGNVIKKIEEQCHTRIITPKVGTFDSTFEITGYKINVNAAKKAIEDKVLQVKKAVV